MNCPWCDQVLIFQYNRVTADCICGARVHESGSYSLRCPVCDKHHKGGKEGVAKCVMYKVEDEWLKRIGQLISTVPFNPEGCKEPIDMGRDRFWPIIMFAILKRDNNTCTECGKTEMSGNYQIHVHHIIPRWAGGTDHPQNLRTLCAKCHTKVHQKMGGFNPSATYRDIVEGNQATLEFTI